MKQVCYRGCRRNIVLLEIFVIKVLQFDSQVGVWQAATCEFVSFFIDPSVGNLER
jgi:hypothetical protein